MKTTLLWIQSLCLLVLTLFAVGCSDSSSTNNGAAQIALSQGNNAVIANATVTLAGAVVGTPVTTTFTISNDGDADLTVSAITIDGSDFSLSKNPEKTVIAGKTTTFDLKFAPSSVGSKTAKLTVANSTKSNFVFTVSAEATAAAVAVMTVVQGNSAVAADSTVALSGAVVGTPLESTFTVKNTGTAELTIGSVSSDNAEFTLSKAADSTVAAGASTAFTLKFSPTTVGSKTAKITIANSASNTFSFSVTSTATAVPAPVIAVSQSSTNIPANSTATANDASLGTPTETTFTIGNAGTAELTVGTITVGGSDFSVSKTPASTVAIGQATTFILKFSPTTFGTKEALVTIENNSGAAFAFSVTAKARGYTVTGAGNATGIAVNGGTLQLSAVAVPANTSVSVMTWSSGSPAVATVDANGLVTAVSNGTAAITAADASGVTGTLTITVNIPFVYFVKQANGTATATLDAGTVTASSKYSSSGNGFKFVSPNYYGTNSNGIIFFPNAMTGDFSIEAEITPATQNKVGDACGIGLGITTGYNPIDSYAYVLMHNNTAPNWNLVYASGAAAVSAQTTPGATFTLNTPMKLTLSRVGTTVNYSGGPASGTLSTGTIATSLLTNGTTVYGDGPVFPAVSFNNVDAKITKLVVKDATGTVVYDSATGVLVQYIPAVLGLSSTSLSVIKDASVNVTATATAAGGAVATVSAVAADPAIVDVSVANGAANSTIALKGLKSGVTTVTVTNLSDTNSYTKTKTITVAVNEFEALDNYGTLATYPTTGATDAYTDGELALTFDAPPTLNTGGTIKIHKLSDGTEVDSIAFSGETLTFGSTTVNVGAQLVRVQGNVLYVTPHLGKLSYGTGYYVAIPTIAITGKINTVAFNGLSNLNTVATWKFTTRAAPALDLTNISVDGSQASTANFRTVQGALSAIANAGTVSTLPTSATVKVAPGTYNELLRYAPVATTGTAVQTVNIIGPAGNAKGDNCIVQWANGNTMNGTTQSRASFYFTGGNLVLQNITLKNTGVRTAVSQAETLYFASGGNSTLAAFNSSFISKQDTLQTSGRNWFYKCYIEGNVDYIWGSASAALFEDCDLHTVNDVASPTITPYALVVSRTTSTGTIGAAGNGTVGKGYVIWKSRVKVDDYATQYFGRDAGAGAFYDQVALIDVAFTSTNPTPVSASIGAGLWKLDNPQIKIDDPPQYVGWKSVNCTWQGTAVGTPTTGTSGTIASQASEYDTRDHILNRVVTVTAGVPNGFQAVDTATSATTPWDLSAFVQAWSAP